MRVSCLITLLSSLFALTASAANVETPPGFKPLFNGKNLDGWQGVVEMPVRERLTGEALAKATKKANEKFLPHWTAQADGVLHYDGKGNSLQTVADYGDFELLLDYRIGKEGDSGIYLRGHPQVQIWDRPDGSGGLFNNEKHPNKPLKKADKPVGEWNTMRILMKGDKVTVHLNGELVVDNVVMENYWDRKKSPTKPLPARGPIELQHHGNPLEFRHIYIREL